MARASAISEKASLAPAERAPAAEAVALKPKLFEAAAHALFTFPSSSAKAVLWSPALVLYY